MHFFRRTDYQPWSRFTILTVALVARFTLVLYSSIHDYVFDVNFTDVDYHVFSDAVHHVAEGRSPFLRATYRYTPVLAWILLPNEKFKDFGKFLFCITDVMVGWLCFKIMDYSSPKKLRLVSTTEEKDDNDPTILPVVLFWLANPLVAVISARGNADALVCAAVLLTIYLILQKKWMLAALAHGILAIHLKIYPLIYLPSIFIHMAGLRRNENITTSIGRLLSNWKGYQYALTAILSMTAIILNLYFVYGEQFLDEFLLYHIHRRDIRHNFSPYFYVLYLVDGQEPLSKVVSIAAFVPQLVSVIYFAFRYHDDLPFCWLLSTFAFVSFNKVCTSQYFIWYIVFLPLVFNRIEMNRREGLLLVGLWFLGQGLWLLPAYFFEFQGWDTFFAIWIASIVFLMINCYIIKKLQIAYRPLYDISEEKKTA